MNINDLELEISGQLLFDDFSSHTPQTPSGMLSWLKNADSDVLLELEISNDPSEPMAKRPFVRAASLQFQGEVDKYLAELQRKYKYGE